MLKTFPLPIQPGTGSGSPRLFEEGPPAGTGFPGCPQRTRRRRTGRSVEGRRASARLLLAPRVPHAPPWRHRRSRPLLRWRLPVFPARSSVSGLAVHATVSQGFMLTTGNDYILTDTTHGSFQLSEMGVNLTKQITDKLRIGAQAFAQNLGMGGNFNLRADWYYLDYRLRDWFGLRFGRLQIPFGLYNEFNDIDAARTPILLPQSVYPLQGRSFLFAQTGFEVYGFAPLRLGGRPGVPALHGDDFHRPGNLDPARCAGLS